MLLFRDDPPRLLEWLDSRGRGYADSPYIYMVWFPDYWGLLTCTCLLIVGGPPRPLMTMLRKMLLKDVRWLLRLLVFYLNIFELYRYRVPVGFSDHRTLIFSPIITTFDSNVLQKLEANVDPKYRGLMKLVNLLGTSYWQVPDWLTHDDPTTWQHPQF